MSRIILHEEAREKILRGCRRLADAVMLTLGPKGRNVIIERASAEPLVTNDGVTIAKEIELDCPFENLGAATLRQASIKTNEQAGDGTTSAIVLANAIMNSASRRVALGESPVLLKDGITAAAKFVAAEILKSAIPVTDLRAVASNSCGNKADGEVVAKAIERVGADGIITIENSRDGKTGLNFVEGLEVACNLVSPYFCEDARTLQTIFDDAHVLLTDQKIVSIKDILPVLEFAAKQKCNLVIIADDYSPEAISALVINKVRAGLRVAALKCSNFADRREAVLNDLAALSDATVISRDNDLDLAQCNATHLGFIKKMVMSLDKNTKVIHENKSQRFEERIAIVKAQIESAKNDEYNRARLCERLARLTNGVAVISVGGVTEVEQKEKRLRIEDAVAATKAACEQGIVAGGGLALVRMRRKLKKHITSISKNLKAGAEVVLECLDAPLRQICTNAGVCPDVVLSRIGKLGYDALNGKYVDMYEASIVDPAKVVRQAICNAASAAGTLLTTEAIICCNDV